MVVYLHLKYFCEGYLGFWDYLFWLITIMEYKFAFSHFWAWRNSCAFKPWTSRYESWTSANLFLVLIIDWSSILFMLNDNITWDIDQINNVFLFQVSDNTSTSFQPVASWQGLSFTYRRHKPKSTPNPWVGSFLQHRHSINFPQKGWDQPRRGCPEDTCGIPGFRSIPHGSDISHV